LLSSSLARSSSSWSCAAIWSKRRRSPSESTPRAWRSRCGGRRGPGRRPESCIRGVIEVGGGRCSPGLRRHALVGFPAGGRSGRCRCALEALLVNKGARLRAAAAASAVVAVAAAGCSSGTAPDAANAPAPAVDSSAPVPSGVAASSGVRASTTTPGSAVRSAPAPGLTPGSTSPATARSLVLPLAVREQLVATWTTAQRLRPSDVSGTSPGSV